MGYSELFKIKIKHGFYTHQYCSDFSIEPTLSCKDICKGHRLLIKNTIDGISVLAQVEEDHTPFINMDNNLCLSFLLISDNPDIKGLTEIDTLSLGSVYHLHNNNLDQVGAHELTQGEISLTDVVQDGASTIFGLIEINNNDSLPSQLNEASCFTISFSAKQEIWKYYLVVDDANFDWNIIDAEEAINFSITDLNEINLAEDRVAQNIKAQYPENNRYLFESESAMAYHSGGRKKLQLKRNDHTLIEHLPNPSYLDKGVKIIKIM